MKKKKCLRVKFQQISQQMDNKNQFVNCQISNIFKFITAYFHSEIKLEMLNTTFRSMSAHWCVLVWEAAWSVCLTRMWSTWWSVVLLHCAPPSSGKQHHLTQVCLPWVSWLVLTAITTTYTLDSGLERPTGTHPFISRSQLILSLYCMNI